ncbi:RidA family protein [Maricaulis salignorans]|uniref:Enamine deaminase RidA, house cleaning of reactive enamine intermediates, YjgF/YER057c/UK114 family n=1 Tax=Maricaulis salignorans TaxID=144026 RepID=A0A1G9UC01_9PROT|nr:RidA family protein [Maricaulis salignorans]SDM57363.1 Enamine deaminase RidA, house cleaning of reactive enamine intermediates, YjgF/YER057c/UK114 family [Maricaulis salignorans]
MAVPARRAFSRAPWDDKVGYCRVSRRGPHVWVTGIVAMDVAGGVYAAGNPEAQARRCFEIIGQALSDVGASLEDVVRTRMFVTSIDHWEAFGRAHGAVFREHPPATTMIEVSRFIGPEFMIEIEADAFVDEACEAA